MTTTQTTYERWDINCSGNGTVTRYRWLLPADSADGWRWAETLPGATIKSRERGGFGLASERRATSTVQYEPLPIGTVREERTARYRRGQQVGFESSLTVLSLAPERADGKREWRPIESLAAARATAAAEVRS